VESLVIKTFNKNIKIYFFKLPNVLFSGLNPIRINICFNDAAAVGGGGGSADAGWYAAPAAAAGGATGAAAVAPWHTAAAARGPCTTSGGERRGTQQIIKLLSNIFSNLSNLVADFSMSC